MPQHKLYIIVNTFIFATKKTEISNSTMKLCCFKIIDDQNDILFLHNLIYI